MLIKPYHLDELKFAWCYRVYFRWRTHRASAQPTLAQLNGETLDSMLQPYDVNILEASANKTDVKVLASVLPTETVAGCVSKTKGRVSKWLREELALPGPQKLLSRGYFASTTGKSSAQAIHEYLESQGEHHGYMSRPRPPVVVKSDPLTPEDEQRLRANHAVTMLRFHVVVCAWRRKGVFSRPAAEAVAEHWRGLQGEYRMTIEKVSFVPDHVHLALHVHPSLAPAKIVVALMNASQKLMWNDFADSVVCAAVERLWQPSAYIGSYWDLESAKIASYVRTWELEEGKGD